jgi:hypothetical protein
MTNPSCGGLPKTLRKQTVSYWLRPPKGTSIAVAVLAIVVLFRLGRFIIDSMEGSQTIPTYEEL